MLKILFLSVISYLLGGIPFGFIVSKFFCNIDIRKNGSCNIGATNVFRVCGKKWGILVFVLDFLKGFIVPFVGSIFLSNASTAIILMAVASVCGHIWTPFLNFKGGKGVATSVGVIAGLSFVFNGLWFVLILSILIWIGAFLWLRIVSIASIMATLCFVLLNFIFDLPLEMKIFSLCLFIFIIFRHKVNIERLLTGQENTFKS